MKRFVAYLAAFAAGGVVSGAAFYVLFFAQTPNLPEERYGFSRLSKMLEAKDLMGNRNGIEDEFYGWVLSQKTEELTRNLHADEEKAIAIAEWIGQNWRNASVLEPIAKSNQAGSKLEMLVFRTGLCGARARLFVFMAELAGLRAQPFSIFNFGRVGGGHSAAQVYYDGDWHYFDVTYAGYFRKDGDVLSFAELIAEKDRALDYLVSIEGSRDVYGSLNDPLSWRRVDNEERMRRVYAPVNLAQADMHGFVGDPTPVTLHFEMSPGDVIGAVDSSNQDVFQQARKQEKSEQIERMGFGPMPFFQSITLAGLKPGGRYGYEIAISKQKLREGDAFAAKTSGCRILAGASFPNGAGRSDSWRILLASGDSNSCILEISHNIRDRGRFVDVDRIAFETTLESATVN